jgi:aspartate--ammonia ligase
MLRTEFMVCETYPQITPFLPEKIYFIHAEELRQMYPDLTSKEREDRITREHGAVFIIGIGAELGNGEPHDLRAPDYDDYSTMGENGLPGLNGDLLIWDSVIDRAVELSSMGIRVDEAALAAQLAERGCEDRAALPFHSALLKGELPYTIGGGIGQSRMCMFFLRKAHIGEVQSSYWDAETRRICREAGVVLL